MMTAASETGGAEEVARVEPSEEKFKHALLDLLREDDRFVTQMGSPNLAAFARHLEVTHYESLRKILSGERTLTPEVMEEVARALGVEPTYFSEYRLAVFRDRFDPKVVGHEQALQNLQEWARGRQPEKKRRH